MFHYHSQGKDSRKTLPTKNSVLKIKTTIKFKKSPVPTNVFFQNKKTEMCFFLTIRTGSENYIQHYW